VSTTTAVPKPTPHRVGMLFEILDEMGEDPTFTFELARVGAATPFARMDVHHAESDGHGGISRFLRDQGIDFESPHQRIGAAPALLERLRAVGRVLRHKPDEPLVLRHVNRTWTRGSKVSHRATAGRLLSADASARVFAAARPASASVTSYLLHGLTEAVVPMIAEPSRFVTWGVPVNMRGPVRIEPDTANASSIMPVKVPRGAEPKAVHAALSRTLADNLHWGKWDQVNAIARLGKPFLRKKVSHYYRTADPSRIGVFSNVGAWRGQTEPDVGVLVYGMPTLTEPLFAAAMTWNGKLTLSLRAHPSLTANDSVVAGWLDAWIAKVGT